MGSVTGNVPASTSTGAFLLAIAGTAFFSFLLPFQFDQRVKLPLDFLLELQWFIGYARTILIGKNTCIYNNFRLDN